MNPTGRGVGAACEVAPTPRCGCCRARLALNREVLGERGEAARDGADRHGLSEKPGTLDTVARLAADGVMTHLHG